MYTILQSKPKYDLRKMCIAKPPAENKITVFEDMKF